MKIILKYVIVLVFTLVVNINTLMSENDSTVFFKKYNSIVLCGNQLNRDFSFSLNIGKVVVADSLFGFDFEIKFDTNKISIDKNPAYFGTFYELCDFSTFSLISSKGTVRVAAGLGASMKPLVGQKEFVGLTGKYIGTCGDSTAISLNYIDFTDEFKRKIVRFDTLWVKPEVQNPTNKIELTKNMENVKTSSNEYSQDFTINFNSKFDSLSLFQNIDNKIEISKIDVDTSRFSVKLSNKEIYLYNKKSSSNTCKLKLTYTIKDTSESFNELITTNLNVLDKCTCLNLQDSNTYILEFTKTASTITENEDEVNYNISNNIIYFSSNDVNVSLCDVMGNVYRLKSENMQVDLNMFSNGLYFLNIVPENKKNIFQKLIIKK